MSIKAEPPVGDVISSEIVSSNMSSDSKATSDKEGNIFSEDGVNVTSRGKTRYNCLEILCHQVILSMLTY